MEDKTFVVTHAHARAPITISGKTLASALKSERLDPHIWKEVMPAAETQESDNGENN